MLRLLRILSLLPLFSIGSLFAFAHPCPGAWSIDAEYLFFWPSIDATYFVIQSDTSSSVVSAVKGTRKTNDFDFQSGFRVGGVYTFCDSCNLELHAYFTRLRSEHKKTIDGGFLWATLGTPSIDGIFQNYTGSATSDQHLLYERVDVFLAKRSFKYDCACPLDFFFEAGGVGAYFGTQTNVEYQAGIANSFVNFRSKVWGIGPQMGLEFDYRLFDLSTCICPGKLTLVGFTSGALLVSRSDSVASSIDGTITPDVKDEHTWRIIPNWFAQIGLNYEANFSCFDASIEVGYEFNSYFRTLAFAIFPSAGSNAFTNFYNFNVQGLYVAVNFGF